MKTSLDWYKTYVDYGLKPIALYQNTKCPVEKKWNQDWSSDRWRHYFEENDHYNMGIILGDIIDVEGDTEEANDFLMKIIDDLPHPMFRSKKSIHHLFLNPDPNITRNQFNGIEFRANKHQSCVPPSFHENGLRYSWLKVTKIPPMPEELYRYYLNNCPFKKYKEPKEQKIHDPNKSKIKPGYEKTECKICKNRFYAHKKRIKLEVKAFSEFSLPWMCHKCREIDVRERCRQIRKNSEITIKSAI